MDFTVVEKRNELSHLKNEIVIKRGIIILIHELLNDFTTFNLILIVSFSEFVRNYIEHVKNKKSFYSGDINLYDIWIHFDKNIKLNTKINFSNDIAEELEKKIIDKFYIDFKDIDNIDKTIKYQVMYDFILQLSSNDGLWDGDNFLYKDKLPLILNSLLWGVGPS
jgi:hypothetical protein